jgi:hypothetical protein
MQMGPETLDKLILFRVGRRKQKFGPASPAEATLHPSREPNAALLVISIIGHSRFECALLGIVAEHVLCYTASLVLLVPGCEGEP